MANFLTVNDAAELRRLSEELLTAVLRMSATSQLKPDDATVSATTEHAKVDAIMRRMREIIR